MVKHIIPPFEEIFSIENLFRVWQDFKKGKKNKKDVADFSMRLIYNLSILRNEILSGTYKHMGYVYFKINDPKSRDIHKATVRDRVLHHAIYNALYPYFDQKFIFDSYSCRLDKGTHKALKRFEKFAKIESCNYKKIVWILKCDIKKCFASVNHDILKSILSKHIKDKRLFSVIVSVIESFWPGIPLGNLTSQLFVNTYLNELDLYVKHRIKAEKYIRYADDFVFFSRDKNSLISMVSQIKDFLHFKLNCSIHERKISIKTLSSGVDFLGWVHFPKYKVLRTKAKRRIFRNIIPGNSAQIASYLGLLKHGNASKIQRRIKSKYAKIGEWELKMSS